MPRSKVASIVWTERSLQNSIFIKQYLENNFSLKEIDDFFSLLEAFEIVVCAYPELYPQSGIKKNIRRAVLSKVLSVYYRINKEKLKSLHFWTIDVIFENGCR